MLDVARGRAASPIAFQPNAMLSRTVNTTAASNVAAAIAEQHLDDAVAIGRGRELAHRDVGAIGGGASAATVGARVAIGGGRLGRRRASGAASAGAVVVGVERVDQILGLELERLGVVEHLRRASRCAGAAAARARRSAPRAPAAGRAAAAPAGRCRPRLSSPRGVSPNFTNRARARHAVVALDVVVDAELGRDARQHAVAGDLSQRLERREVVRVLDRGDQLAVLDDERHALVLERLRRLQAAAPPRAWRARASRRSRSGCPSSRPR